MAKRLNLKIKLWFVAALVLLSVGVYFWMQKNITLAPSVGTTTPISAPTATSTQPEIKNLNITNTKRDFSGLNDGQSISFAWSPASEGVVEYVLFRSDSPSGPFTEMGRVTANRSPNAVDYTPDVRLKDLCYRLEARDRNGNIVREYEQICVLKFRE